MVSWFPQLRELPEIMAIILSTTEYVIHTKTVAVIYQATGTIAMVPGPTWVQRRESRHIIP